MVPILITSNSPYAGRTLVALGLSLKLKAMDYDVGYLKPLGALASEPEHQDSDALFAKEVLGLVEPLETIAPFVPDAAQQSRLLVGELKDVQKQVLSAFRELKKKDFVVIAGAADLFEGSLASLDALSIAEATKARVLVVEPWRGDLSLDTLYGCSGLFGKQFAGAVLNKVPADAMDRLKQEIRPALLKRGVSIFGTFLRDRFLESVTVRQISEVLGGKLLCCHDRLNEHVENFLIGAMDVNSASAYFRRTPNMAVITGAHRSDIQLAAMESSAKCIIITGGQLSAEAVMSRARETNTPVLSVPGDTFSAISRIEAHVGKTVVREREKVDRIRQILDAEFDMFGFLSKLKKV
jgi:BioD-like phosphotransacetylase family protein